MSRRLQPEASGAFARGATLARVAIAALATGAIAACSLIVNRASAQCETDSDCAAFGAAACVQGGCVLDTAVPEGGLLDVNTVEPANLPCTTTQDCLGEHAGVNWICRHPDQICVQLTSPDCPLLAGDYISDDALVLGVVLPLYGPHASTGAALVNAVKLALHDFVGGLPPTADGGLPRPIGVVFCDESQNATRAAKHLRDDLGLAAILGTGGSATTLAVANAVTVPSGQFLISPRATANLAAFQTKNTVWRTCPSDAIEGAAIAALARSVAVDVGVQHVRSAVALTVLRATDVESTQLDGVVSSTLVLNGSPAKASANAGLFADITYGDPDSDLDPNAAFANAIAKVTTATTSPDVVVVLGRTQAVHGIIQSLEAGWPARFPLRPVYVVSSGLQTSELLALLGTNADLRARVLGTAPGEDTATYANLAKFIALYDETFADGGSPVTFGAAQSYDAFYTLAYAAAMARNTDLVGRDISGALGLLLASADAAAPVTISVGPDGIPAAYAAIMARTPVVLQGASAPLAFDVKTGNLVTDVQVWCVVDTSKGVAFVDSGQRYATGAGVLQGTLSNGCRD